MRSRKAEREGVLVLCILVALFFFITDLQGARESFFLLAKEENAGDAVVSPGDTTARPEALPARRRPVPPRERVELNSADSATLVMVQGIGPYYASRILRYRERLGGFYSASQLRELNAKYLLVDSLLPLLTVDTTLIRKQAMDTMSFSALLRHPYLEYEHVQLILNARKAAGDTLSCSLLERERVLPPRVLKKIRPYFH